jgi:enoyl-CoA hydratase/carnithine racemase
MGRALHLVTTGAVYEAKNPLFDGLFTELLPSPEAVLPRAIELAEEIANNTSTVSTNLMRELMYRNPGTAEGAHLLDSEVISGLFGGPDNTEGVKSFKEKRPAKFTATMLEDAPAAYPWWEPVSTASRPHPKGKSPKPRL